MIEKLLINTLRDGKYLTRTTGSRVDLAEKINEIIDYLNAKEANA